MDIKSTPSYFRNRLRQGDVVFGVFCKTTSPEMIECLGYAGFDFCILDQEHGPIGMETLQNLVRAAEMSSHFFVLKIKSGLPLDKNGFILIRKQTEVA